MAAMSEALGEALAPLQRVALAYAPARSRPALLALLSLDARLAGIVRHSREPMLAQLRLTWWREQLIAGAGAAESGDPLLDALRAWPGERAALAGLAEGWEALTGAAPLPQGAFAMLADARGAAFAALAGSRHADALRMARGWALADLAAHLSDLRERDAVLALATAHDWRQARLPRGLRPLAVLHALAARAIRRNIPLTAQGPAAAFGAMRVGLLGR